MFTGIVEEVGTLLARVDQQDAAQLRIRARKALEGVALGDSIAVNGVCLTVTGFAGAGPGSDSTAEEWTTDVMAETLRRSSLGALGAGPSLVGDLGIDSIGQALELTVVDVTRSGRDVAVRLRPNRHTGTQQRAGGSGADVGS